MWTLGPAVTQHVVSSGRKCTQKHQGGLRACREGEHCLDAAGNAGSQPQLPPPASVRTCTLTRPPGDLPGCWGLQNVVSCFQSSRQWSPNVWAGKRRKCSEIRAPKAGSVETSNQFWQKLNVNQVRREGIGEQDQTESKWDCKITWTKVDKFRF